MVSIPLRKNNPLGPKLKDLQPKWPEQKGLKLKDWMLIDMAEP